MDTTVVEKEFLPQPKGKSVLVDFKNPIGSPVCPWEVMSPSKYLHQQYDTKRRTQVCESKEQGPYSASDATGWVTLRKPLLVLLATKLVFSSVNEASIIYSARLF